MAAEVIMEPTSLTHSARERAVGLALDKVIQSIQENPEYHGKTYKITRYDKRSSASGTVHTLKGKYGTDATGSGWTFSVKLDDDPKFEGKAVILGTYEPDKVVDGKLAEQRAEWDKNEAEKTARYKENQRKKKEEAERAKTAQEVPAEKTDDPSTARAAAKNRKAS